MATIASRATAGRRRRITGTSVVMWRSLPRTRRLAPSPGSAEDRLAVGRGRDEPATTRRSHALAIVGVGQHRRSHPRALDHLDHRRPERSVGLGQRLDPELAAQETGRGVGTGGGPGPASRPGRTPGAASHGPPRGADPERAVARPPRARRPPRRPAGDAPRPARGRSSNASDRRSRSTAKHSRPRHSTRSPRYDGDRLLRAARRIAEDRLEAGDVEIDRGARLEADDLGVDRQVRIERDRRRGERRPDEPQRLAERGRRARAIAVRPDLGGDRLAGPDPRLQREHRDQGLGASRGQLDLAAIDRQLDPAEQADLEALAVDSSRSAESGPLPSSWLGAPWGSSVPPPSPQSHGSPSDRYSTSPLWGRASAVADVRRSLAGPRRPDSPRAIGHDVGPGPRSPTEALFPASLITTIGSGSSSRAAAGGQMGCRSADTPSGLTTASIRPGSLHCRRADSP